MSNIHYFQRYSQKENVATNNTLLLFSRLYNQSPIKFSHFLNKVLGNDIINIGINIEQQVKNNSSIPDGIISQDSFKIVIETKLDSKGINNSQLEKHLESFNQENIQVLLTLSPNGIKNKDEEIKNTIKEYNAKQDCKIEYTDITFKTIIDVFRETINDYDFELRDIIDDFEEYCISSGLITFSEYKMRAIPCRDSLEENLEYNLYYAPSDRNFSEHSYIGLYKDKTIKAIGKIENIITADFDGNELKIKDKIYGITDIQEKNIINVILKVKEENGWNIFKNHTFFCVEKFVSTNFIKKSPYGIQKSKFFDLSNYIDISKSPSIDEIAEILEGKKWK